jgi:hypothetical protein
MREKIHEEENVLDDGELHFMYDSAYGDIKFGTIHGLTPCTSCMTVHMMTLSLEQYMG